MAQTTTSLFTAAEREAIKAKALRIREARRERTADDNRLAQLMRTK